MVKFTTDSYQYMIQFCKKIEIDEIYFSGKISCSSYLIPYVKYYVVTLNIAHLLVRSYSNYSARSITQDKSFDSFFEAHSRSTVLIIA